MKQPVNPGATRLVAGMTCVCLTLSIACTQAGHWSGYRCDNGRSGASSEALRAPLYLQWTRVPRHRPRPAWPDPGDKEVQRMAFDYAFQVAIADGLVVFGSSADHKITALDLTTGAERWSVFTGGPIRFAPAISGERVLIASDDGFVYCLTLVDGRLLWRVRGGPRDDRLMGNEQMISRWPARSGVLVDGDTAYATFGMWQSDAIYVVAFRVRDGAVAWKNDTISNLYMALPHSSEEGIAAVSPQGHLALCGDTLVVPCGRAMPAGFDRRTGKLLFCNNGSDKLHHAGGAWVMAAGDMVFGNRRPVQGHPHVSLREKDPPPGSGLLAWDRRTGRQRLALAGKHRAVFHGGMLYASGDGELVAVDMAALAKHAEAYYGAGKVDPDLSRKDVRSMMYWKGAGYPWGPWKVVPVSERSATRWKTKVGRTYELILAGDTLVAGGRGEVVAFAANTGKRLWRAEIKGEVRGLAACDGYLIVSSTTGEILCFGPSISKQARVVKPAAAVFPDPGPVAAEAARVLKDTSVQDGCALVLGVGRGLLAGELARRSKLTVICVDPDPRKVKAARRMLDAAGLYGPRVVVHQAGLDRLPYARFFANLIVVDSRSSGSGASWPASELYRVLHPFGGVLWAALPDPAAAGDLQRSLVAAGVPTGEITVRDAYLQVVRGQLPGAVNWTHEYGDPSRPAASADTRVRLPLKMLWFGKPGPARIISRHWRTPAPLFVDGRMFVAGENHVIAVDAYNGRQLWSREIPGIGRYPGRYRGGGIVADNDSVYGALGTSCLRLDAATGKPRQTYTVPRQLLDETVQSNPIRKALDAGGRPARPTPNKIEWEFLAVTNRYVVGSVGEPNFAWTGWPEAHPECKHVFVLGKKDGRLIWSYTAAQSISPNAICIKAGRLYLIDRTGRAAIERARMRGRSVKDTPVLKALDLTTGKTIWETRKGLAGRLLWMGDDVLLVTKGATSAYASNDGRLLWSKHVPGFTYPVITNDTVYMYPRALDLHTGAPRERRDPMTDRPMPWRMAYKGGCGSFSGCPAALFVRSGAAGMVDLAQDSGMAWLGQVRASCWVNMIAAGGMLLAPEGASSCSCPYNYQTSLAMVPDTRYEQWFVFPDTGAPAGSRIRKLAVNFGAVGDKRGPRGTLWAAFPRPFRPGALTVPLFAMNLPTYYRRNADEYPIAGTDRPWLYTYGAEGLKKADLELFLGDPACAPGCRTPPRIDGLLRDECWNGDAPLILTSDNQATDQSAVAFLRHDKDALYIGFKRTAPRRNGKFVPWRGLTHGTDTRPWDDDSFGIRLWDGGTRTGVYLHISNTGATFDGRTAPGMYLLIGADKSWNGEWRKAVHTTPEAWSAEIAVPWQVLAKAGIRRNRLSVYLESVNRTGVGPERLQFKYRTLRRLYLFKRTVPVAYRELPDRPPRLYNVVLHFAELADVAPGERVFDVLLQGKTVISGLDVVKEAGGRNRALAKTVHGVSARNTLSLELRPRTGKPPIISALEVQYDEVAARKLARQSADRGLVAHWTFDGKDAKTAKDTGPDGNHGAVIGAQRVDGRAGKALQFDGERDSVNCGSRPDLNITDELTISAWVNIHSYHRDLYHDIVLSKGVGAYSIFLHRKGGGAIRAYVTIGGTAQSLPIHAPGFDEWHHIAVTVRDGEQKTYYDGVIQSSTRYAGAIGTTDHNLVIGYSENFPSAGHFNGKIDDVRIAHAILSPETIQWLSEAGRQ